MISFFKTVLSAVSPDQLTPIAKIVILILVLGLSSIPALQAWSDPLLSLAREIALSFSVKG